MPNTKFTRKYRTRQTRKTRRMSGGSLNIVQRLRAKPAHEAMRLIGSAPRYITDSNLVNLLNQYDFNSRKNDARLIQQLRAFDGVPGLKAQVDTWLSS
jgi:hypothetical protein